MTKPTPPSDQNPWAPPPEGFQVPPAPPAPEQFGPPTGPPPGYRDGQQGGFQGGYPGGHQGGYPGGYGYPMPPPHDAPRNGMGITSLLLGITGVVLGMVVVLFWMSWLPALLAVVFGFVALGHVKKGTATNKGMAVSGMILGMVGILLAVGGGVFAVTSLKDSVREIDRKVAEEEASESREAEASDKELSEAEKERAAVEASESAEAADKAEAAKPKAFGSTYTYKNGVSITVGKPVPYTASSTAAGHTRGYKSFTVKITLKNGSKEKFDSLYAIPRFKDADDAEVQKIFDGDVPSSFRGALHPGRSKTGTYAFDLPPEAAGAAGVEMSPGIGYDEAVWSGPTK
ncbi:DUF4190 domain-containing protein [Streptomyces sp. NPDC054863]